MPSPEPCNLQAYVLHSVAVAATAEMKAQRSDTEGAQTWSRQSRTGAATTGAYIGSTSEALPISVHGQTTTACTPTKLSACINPSCPAAALWVKTNCREQNWHQAFFPKHNKKLVIKYKKSGKLNNELLKKPVGQWKNQRGNRKYLKTAVNENTTFQNLCNATKAALRMKIK